MATALTPPTEGSIVLTRPISEVKDYFTHLEVPTIYFMIRLVKTCVMSIFRWHFYDVDNVLVVTNSGQYLHTFDGSLKSQTSAELRQDHPFMLNHAAFLLPKNVEVGDEVNKVEQLITKDKIKFEDFQTNLTSLSLTHVVNYYRDSLKIDGFTEPKKSKGALKDLWENKNFGLGSSIRA